MSPRSPNNLNSAIHVTESTKNQIRLGAAILDKTMGQLVEDAVDEFLINGRDMIEANQAAIFAGEAIPYPIDAYSEEIARRRSA